MSRSFVFWLVFAGCAGGQAQIGVSTDPAPPNPPGTPEDPAFAEPLPDVVPLEPLLQTGSRLVPLAFHTEGGVLERRGFWDSLLQITCTVLPSGPDTWHCLPHSNQAINVMHLTGDCSDDPVMNVLPTCMAREYEAVYEPRENGCNPLRYFRPYRVGGSVPMTPGTTGMAPGRVYGTCAYEDTWTNSQVWQTQGPEPLDTFVAFTRAIAVTGDDTTPFAVYLGADGSRVVKHPSGLDGERCLPLNTSDGVRCMPYTRVIRQADERLFADAACSRPVAPVHDADCALLDTDRARVIDPSQNNTIHPIVGLHEGTVWEDVGGDCVEHTLPSDESAIEIGGAWPNESFGQVQKLPIVENVSQTWWAVAGTPVVPDELPTLTANGAVCVPMQAGSEVVCLPPAAEDPVYFADASCTEPLAGAPGDWVLLDAAPSCLVETDDLPEGSAAMQGGEPYEGVGYQRTDTGCEPTAATLYALEPGDPPVLSTW